MLAVESQLFGPKWQSEHLMSLAWLSAPLGVVMLLLSLNANIPRYLLQRYNGEAALGYFAAMAYMVVASNTVISALGQSAAPRFARSYVGDRPAFVLLLSKMVWLAAGLGVSGVLVVATWGRQILGFVYQPDYGDHADVFLLLTVAGSADLLASALGYSFTATRRFASYLLPYAFNTVAGFAIGLFLIPTLGLRGAAFTGLAISLSQLLAVSLLLRRALTIPRSQNGQTTREVP
jgi:O-antigen/teichoic acid export membrane protein